jgi:hypothetical protein
VIAGKEVVVPCMADASKEDMHLRRARVQRLKASLKLQDYNPKRDFAGWGGEDLRRLVGMAGFTHLAGLGAVGPEAQGVSVADFDGDGKFDFCLSGGGKTALLQNGGEAYSEANLPNAKGARAAVWADYNGDHKPDLLLATPTGPRLYTNLGGGNFRDDSALLPPEPCYHVTAAAWMDADGDGKPDVLLGNGFHGLRLYRNTLNEEVVKQLMPPKLGDWHVCGPFRNEFDTAYPPEQEIDLKKQYPVRSQQAAVWRKMDFPDGRAHDLRLAGQRRHADGVGQRREGPRRERAAAVPTRPGEAQPAAAAGQERALAKDRPGRRRVAVLLRGRAGGAGRRGRLR